MPVHILPESSRSEATFDNPRLSRRAFLARLAAAGAAVALGSRAGRAAPPETERAWALVADTHVHASDGETRRGQNMARNLERVIAEILEESPRGAVVDGDLALSAGNPGDYEALLRHTAPLTRAEIPLHMTLGNHDHRGHFLQAAGVEAATPPVDGKHVSSFVADGIHWILLDSLDVVNAVPGTLGKEQRKWLAERLDAEPAEPAVLFVHHNPEKTPSGLQDRAEFLEVLIPRRQVKAVFFGHTHSWRRWEEQGIHMVNLPATAYTFSEGQPLGWVRAAIRPGSMEIELRSLDRSHPEHGTKHELTWRSPRAQKRVRI